jgi:glycosyltransferase involved in cell wall biosynthesis
MISILIPIYNGIEYIDESISSVIKQTYPEWEIIVGINGHPENSDIFKLAKVYEEQSNNIKVLDLFYIKGKPSSLNEMIKFSSYEWIAILDVDDIWHPTKLEKQINFLNRYDVIGTKCEYFGDRTGSPNIPVGDLSNFDFFSCNPIINSSSLIKKSLCNWNNIFLDDYDLWLRLWKQNKNFYNCDEILVKHRIDKKSAFNYSNNNYLNDLLLSYSIPFTPSLVLPVSNKTFTI